MVKSLFLCEGGDDIGFLNLFIKYLGLKNIVIKKLDNKSNFFKIEIYREKKIIDMFNTRQYNKLLLIFDSDFQKDNAQTGGFENSKREIKSMIGQLKKEIKYSCDIDYCILCNPVSKNGNLEHLIISTLSQDKQKCVNDLLECIKPYKNNGDKKIVLSSYKTIFDEPNYNFRDTNFELLGYKLEQL